MNKSIYYVACSVFLLPQLGLAESAEPVDQIAVKTKQTAASFSQASKQTLQQQLDEMQSDYDQRLSRLESRLKQTQKNMRTKKANTFNPGISLILNGNLASYENEPENYQLPGFALGEEAGLAPEGFSLDESEVTLSASVDQLFYGQATLSLADDAGETSVETEEAYFETLGLGNGLTIKAGRFFSALGYINEKHKHVWDFVDAPLVYRGLFGDQLKQDGARLSWLLPTDTYFLIGSEAGNGVHYPSAGNHSGVGDWLAYIETGGDIGTSHSWQLGLSFWQADDVKDRASQGLDAPVFNGDSKIEAIDMVYKWAPDGNAQQQNLILQAEFFHRSEQGRITLNDTAQSSRYDGSQNGWYAQAVYQFKPQWKTGLRYDRLQSNNTGSDNAVLGQAGLLDNGTNPQRVSLMLTWSSSEFSRIRAQINRDESAAQSDNQFLLQYTMIMGAHGAHSY